MLHASVLSDYQIVKSFKKSVFGHVSLIN